MRDRNGHLLDSTPLGAPVRTQLMKDTKFQNYVMISTKELRNDRDCKINYKERRVNMRTTRWSRVLDESPPSPAAEESAGAVVHRASMSGGTEGMPCESSDVRHSARRAFTIRTRKSRSFRSKSSMEKNVINLKL